MKTNIISPPGESRTNTRPLTLYPLKLALLVLALAGFAGTANAITYTNANNASSALNLTADWLVAGGAPSVLPGTSDTILFTGPTVTTPLGGSLSVNGMAMDTGATTSMRISSTTGATLTLGAGGITKTYAGNKMELSCNLALSANQVWTNAGNNIQVDSSAAWTFNGYTLTMTGAGTFDNRSTVNFGTNVNINCTGADMNYAAGDFNMGSGSNSFTTFTLTAGTVEGSTFPTNALATTSSAFGAGSCAIALNGGPATLIYNGTTVATPEKITWGATGANAINVSQSGQTLTLSNLVYASGSGQTSNSFLNFGGAGNLTLARAVSNAPSSAYNYSINKSGGGTLTLSGTNLYSGNTLVNGGTFALTGNASISNTPVISLGAGTAFSVSGLSSTFVLQSSQIISNSSVATATVNGSIDASSSAIAGSFKSGVAPFTIQNGTLTISSSTVFSLNYTGSARTLAAGASIPIVSKGTGGSVGGTAPNSSPHSIPLPGGADGHLAINSGELDLVVDTGSSVGATEPLHWTGTGSSTWDANNSGNKIWKDSSGSPLSVYYLDGDSVQFDEQYIGANQTVALETTVNPASILVSNATYNYAISSSSGLGMIGGIARLTKLGTATLTLATSNAFTGGLVISNGTVQMGSPAALGAKGGSVFVNSNAVLDVNGMTMTTAVSNIVTINGTGTGAGALINSNTTAATFYGSIALGSASTIASPNGNLTLNGGPITGNYPLTLGSGNIAISASLVSSNASLIVNNGGTLNPASSYGGGTYLLGGQLLAYNLASFGTGPIYLGATSGSLAPNLSPSIVNSIWTNPVIVVAGSSGTPALYNHGKSGTTWAGSITLSNNLQLFASGGNMTVSGPISGPDGLNIGQPTHTSAFVFTGTNTYTGPTYVSMANLDLTGNGSVSNSAAIIVSGGQTFDVTGLSVQPSPFTLSPGQILANGFNGIGQIANLSGSFASGSGTLLLTCDGSDACFSVSTGFLLVSSQTLVIVNPAATLTVGNTYTLITGVDPASTLPTLQMLRGVGSLEISGGSLNLVVTSMATPGLNEPLHWAGTGAGLWQVATPTNIWEDSSTPAVYTGYSDLDSVQFDEQFIGANQVVTLNGVVTPSSIVVSNSSYSYTVTGFGAISGSGGLTKTGPGTFTLANGSANFSPNTYTGATTVSNGTLMVNASIASPVIVNGGMLSGLGTINNTVTVNSGGTLVPGTNGLTTATWLTVDGDLTLNSGSTTAVTVMGGVPAVNLVNMPSGGNVTYGGTLSIMPAGTFHIGDSYTLFAGPNTTNTSYFTSITGSPGAGMAFAFTNGILSVVNQPAPNPTNLVVTTTGPNSLSLNWPAGQGWQLQSNSVSLVNTSAWQTVTGATPPYPVTISPNQTNVFFRLKY